MLKTDFIWDEELVIEYLQMVTPADDENYWRHELNRFKQSKIKEKERIEVDTMFTVLEDTALKILFNKQVPDERLPAIKAAIEFVINGEQPKNDTTHSLTHEYVTKEECERREEDAWNFAREKVVLDRNPQNKQYRYLSFDQYKSLKNSKQSK